ncbi:diacylglycerol kinase, putative [Entamoeba histolytica HM-1:IMSS-B]|uniref:Diacylglycerol kinase n=6 Tax=Entamoeba histolytica TaxID=5759 RepID=C4LSD5_ENTH1|nr:diacylglycerol kinase, putative [Entamoeba histolytica HM-1:IMSS]EMD42902.1 diacylglycerol kinase theta, putative [Entamoeba histolytica KU27]EMH73233.1 diacylglycerol kinase, putative [Entamoeba histolytica HM-1:IMSS-B]EMS17100.1 diacylglycerol kinase, theta, putative [Entamoeba histolytica HM-3:IMSS]ENY61288.1 diacylglycerol kinase, theta, putative [Entamoeba histolytica HM-1:IMSS-A]GAT91601.1 diacylglycerol kinase putative [Entamoeba histolytica]|eukprot:XP_656372.1 diacylglycerol kinase, putative [Entamoeba histolytica HM-1:IMSS]
MSQTPRLIPVNDFILCNLHVNAHKFQIITSIASCCDVCGSSITPFSRAVKCETCNLLVHEDCTGYCYLPCFLPQNQSQSNSLESSSLEEIHNHCINGQHILEKTVRMSPTFCTVCRSSIVSSALGVLKCRICECYVHSKCVHGLSHLCRPVASPSNKEYHWFVPGNCNSTGLTTHTCYVCKKSVGSSLALTDFRCCYCGMFVHPQCIQYAPAFCYHGVLGKYILSPSVTEMDSEFHFKAIKRFDKEPMIFFINRKSGNLLGEQILKETQYMFSIPQVCDVFKGFEPTFEYIKPYGDNFIAVVCGGDGTVGWVMNELRKAELKPKIFVIPLGTGNDLSHCTGWGGGYNGEDIEDLLRNVSQALVQKLDRWQVSIHSEIVGETRKLIFNNYFSIGLDAGIALNFHLRREANPDAFNSRIINKIQYVFSSPQALTEDSGDIDKVITLIVDGKRIKLEPMQGLVFLNLVTYGGGVRFWDRVTPDESIGGLKDSNFGDGLVEVVGFKSVIEIPLIMSGMQKPVKIAQGKVIELELTEKKPAQTDGEPFILNPCKIVISLYDKVKIMVKNSFY